MFSRMHVGAGSENFRQDGSVKGDKLQYYQVLTLPQSTVWRGPATVT